MFYSGANYSKLKTNLKLAINRLKLLEKKKTELALKARREISTYLGNYKIERAKIRVEHIIREDYVVEAMETVEMFCDLLLARFGLIQQMKNMDPGIEEAISSILWAAPRLQTDIPELKVISEQLASKYGKIYQQACLGNATNTVNRCLMQRLSVEAPPAHLVDSYLCEIAKSHNVPYISDFKPGSAEITGELLNFNDDDKGMPPGGGSGFPGGYGGGNSGGGGGIGFRNDIIMSKNSTEHPHVPPQIQRPFDYQIPFIPAAEAQCPPPPPYTSVDLEPGLNPAKGKQPLSNPNYSSYPAKDQQPPSNPDYSSYPAYNAVPKPQRRGASENRLPPQPPNSDVLPELPDVPNTNVSVSEPDEPNFDDLAARFEALKKLK